MSRTSLSASPVLDEFLRKHAYTLGLVECTERELGTLLRAAESGVDPAAEAEVLAQIRERGFIMSGLDVEPGDKVRDTTPLGPMNAVVTASDTHSVTIDYGTEQTPGVPGSRYAKHLNSSLRTGALKHA